MNGRWLAALAAACAALTATAQTYPSKPIRIIVPFSAGGPADLLARVIGEKLTRSLNQSIVVLNKDGAGTILGVDMAAKANPDGYTLLLGNVAMVINTASGKKLPYDMLRDLAPISLAFTQPLILVINPSVPLGSVKELIAYAKSNPGKLKYGSSGVGTSIHLTTELFRTAVGVELTHVPYKGVAPAMTDLLGGQIDLMFPGITPAVPHVKSGKLKALAVTSRKRASALPEVPTFIEEGVNYEATGWYGMLAPAGTPRDIIARLHTELVKTLNLEDVKERLASQGGEATSSSPDQFAAFMRAELAKWTRVIKASNIRVE
ncbi:MAG TPA: tripartite tricarboxylate transporter substrate binding protein [Burkholderiales bacterium]|nr:tripartite tricarboxylate transporter substrate binding protein [Burkholderiales bacterium]